MKLDLMRSWRVVAGGLIVVSQGVAADGGEAERSIEVKAQQLPQALMDFSEQTGMQLAYMAGQAEGKISKGTRGQDEPEAALSDILEGTRLAYQFVNQRTVAIGPQRSSPRPAQSASGPQPVLLAQQPAQGGGQNEEPDAETDDGAAEDDALELGNQIVTGTRLLRASWETPGQMIVFSAEDLLNTGEPTLERALRQLPQNINGTTEFGSRFGDNLQALQGTANINGSSTVNLRGLGESATLILVNGKRAGESGLLGGFTDISEFPVSMIDRVEIQLDGASAVYGSDAIGGVVNVILKKDFDLARVSLRRTARTGGGLTEDNATAAYSFSWGQGRATFSWDGYRASDQDASTTSLLGLEVFPYSNPGTVRARSGTIFTPPEISPDLTEAAIAAGAIAPGEKLRLVQLPAGQDGTGLSLDNLSQWTVNAYATSTGADRMERRSVTPGSDRHTLRAYASHEFSNFEMSGGITWATRRTGRNSGPAARNLNFRVPAANPYNPFGTAVNVNLDTSSFFGTREVDGERDSITADLDFSGALGGSWEWELKSRLSEREVLSESIGFVNFRVIEDLTGIESTDPAQALNVFGDSFLTDGNNAAILAAAGYQVPDEISTNVNRTASSELIVKRALHRLPAGPIRSVFGAEWRRNSIDVDYAATTYGARVVTTSSPIGCCVDPISQKGSRTLRAGFAELFVPIFSKENAARGLRDLNITLGARHESAALSGRAVEGKAGRYSQNVWSAGLVYRPVEAVTARFAKSTGFRAPDAANILLPVAVRPGFGIDFRGGGFQFANFDIISGGNADLLPEESTSLTSGIEFRPPFLPGLALKASYHDTSFVNRIANPNPLGSFIINDVLFGVFGFQYELDEEGNITSFDGRSVNIALQDTRGWDYSLDWRFGLGGHSFGFSASVAVSEEHRQDINTYDMEAPTNQVGTFIPKNSYRSTAFWERWGWRLSLTAYTRSGVRYSYPATPDFDSLPPLMEPDRRGRVMSASRTVTVMAKTDPALVANLRGSVDFGEFWPGAPPLLDQTRLSFGINNIGKAYDKVKLDPEIESGHFRRIRNSFDARGQLYYLEISTEF
ncbi:MAG: TonB-dependent receptor [Gammaproteobacteria bacterium]|nr:TonB-dependent receptor [Gammaproteobacteria bacterium]